MRIAVCIKQIPLVGEAGIAADTKRLDRSGACVISAFDLRALAVAVDLRQRFGGQAVAVTMGPPRAAEALREALAMGLDRAVHLQDPLFAGSDTLATARALSAWLGGQGFDLVLAGKYALDADTGQVGPEIAELLGVPHVAGVQRLELRDRFITVERETDEGYEEVTCPLPAVITCAERLAKPIRVSDEARTVVAAAIETLDAATLGGTGYGIEGSPTRVGEIRTLPRRARAGHLLASCSPAEAASQLLAAIETWGCLEPSDQAPTSPSGRPRAPGIGKDVFVACEVDSLGAVSPVSLELVEAAATLADQIGGAVVVLFFGRSGLVHADLVAAHGADRVLVLDLSEPQAAAPEVVAAALAPVIEEHGPWALLAPATVRGRDWAPRLAARLGLGLTGDAIGLQIDSAGRLVALKPALGGSVVAEIRSDTLPQMVTMRPGMLGRGAPVAGRRAEVLMLPAPSLTPALAVLSRHRLVDEATAALEHARVVIGVGMGIGGPEALPAIRALAARLGASLCATRRVADAGWLPRQVQVGITGKGLSAGLYLGLGVGGSFNHTAGLERVGRIVAIDKDPQAAMFKCADLGVVGDCLEMTHALEAALGACLPAATAAAGVRM